MVINGFCVVPQWVILSIDLTLYDSKSNDVIETCLIYLKGQPTEATLMDVGLAIRTSLSQHEVPGRMKGWSVLPPLHTKLFQGFQAAPVSGNVLV